MSDFFKNLMISAPALPDRMFPTFPRLQPVEPAPVEPKLVRPVYSYDWTEIDEIRDGALVGRVDEIRKQLMAQLIPGVLYDFGTTEEKASTFIWARPVRVHPDFAPHVMAWGDVLIGAVATGAVV